MGLITEEVEANLCGSNINYYEDLGYDIPRRKDKQGRLKVQRGTKLKVKVYDLPSGSNVAVQVKCDGCGKILNISYNRYTTLNRDGLYYCHKCVMKLYSGQNHGNWNPEKTDEERIIQRNYPEYVEFTKRVLARDNYTCRCCGKRNTKLFAHHLNGYHWYVEGRIDDSNAIALCEECHKAFHNLYGRKNNTKEQFEEWIGCSIESFETYKNDLVMARKIFCIEENKIYDSVDDLHKKWGAPRSQIYYVCNHKTSYRKIIENNELKIRTCNYQTVCGKHLLWYDEYLNMSEEDIQDFLNKNVKSFYKKVICITTGKVFETIADAKRYYNLTVDISGCCKGRIKHAGKLPSGKKLQWMYYDDYLKTLENEQEELSDENIA